MTNYLKKELVIDDCKQERYFTPLELNRDNLLFVDFLFYLDQYYHDNKIKNVDVYNQILSVFDEILKGFFQNPLKINDNSRKSIKIRLVKYLLLRYVLVNQEYKKDIKEIFHNSGFIELGDFERIDKIGYLKLISSLYQDMDTLGNIVQCKKEKHEILIRDFNKEDPLFQKKEYSTIVFLQNQIKKKISQQIDFFLIHGSYATADFVDDWSDLDSFIVLNKNVFNNIRQLEYVQKELQKLSLLCYKINPLAHHTFFIYPDLILKNYSNQFLPIQALKESIALLKKDKLMIDYSGNKLADFYAISIFLNRFREKVIEDKYSRNIFSYQNDIADVLLLPPLMLQIKGEPIYKKYAFEKIKSQFAGFDLSIIDFASQKRKEWKLFNWLRFYPNLFFNLLPTNWNNYLVNKYRFYLMRFKEVDALAVKDFTKRALNLYEEFFQYALKNFKK